MRIHTWRERSRPVYAINCSSVRTNLIIYLTRLRVHRQNKVWVLSFYISEGRYGQPFIRLDTTNSFGSTIDIYLQEYKSGKQFDLG